MEITWTASNGKRILVIDFTGIKMEKDMVAWINKLPDYLKDLPDDHDLRLFVDMTGTFATSGFVEASKKIEIIYDRFNSVKRAVIGVEGAKAILLKGFNLFAKRPMQPFATREEAFKYLVK